MRTPVLAAVAAAGLLSLALPSTAAEPLTPCAPVDGATVVSLAAPSSQTFAAPAVPGVVASTVGEADAGVAETLEQEGSSATFDFVLDASGSAVADATRSTGTVNLSWADDSDYDMFVTDATGRQLGAGTTFNPETGGGETAGTGVQKHCTVVTVEILNYVGLPGSMTLDVSVAGHKK